MDASIPKQIGRYQIDRLLGSGAMGHVFLGRDPELDRPVAIKTVRNLDMEPSALATFLERFRNEARAAARLHHPNIVQVYDVGEDPGAGPYLVFEYVAGSTLKQRLLARGPLDPEAVCRLADDLASALALAHQHGIIHRDIKPDNVLLTPEGTAKLADFGVARMPNAALTREGQFLGTPCYAAPETLDGGSYGPGSDLFSFAAMLYELISGARAFAGTDAIAVAHKILHDPPRPLRQTSTEARIPEGVEAVIMRGLEKSPEARQASVSELADALRDAYVAAGLVREPSRSWTTGELAARGPQTRRESSGTAAFTAILVGALVTGVGIVLAFARDRDPALPDAGIPAGASDAGVGAPDAGTTPDAGLAALDAGPPDAGRDASNGEPPDAGPVPLPDLDPPADPYAHLTPHEREEDAKDALAEARSALADGDVDTARDALDRAEQLDPGNEDIELLRSRLLPR